MTKNRIVNHEAQLLNEFRKKEWQLHFNDFQEIKNGHYPDFGIYLNYYYVADKFFDKNWKLINQVIRNNQSTILISKSVWDNMGKRGSCSYKHDRVLLALWYLGQLSNQSTKVKYIPA